MPGKSIEHFTHPGHLLAETCSETRYLCDGCKTPGQGTRYSCSNIGCDFVLHTYCGTCSLGNESGGGLISSFMHPQHPLCLVVRKAHGMRLNERICNVCGEQVEGLFYRCKDCDFDLHPLCTQLPQYLNHPQHQLHSLKLESSSSHDSPSGSRCAVCRGECTSWRYGCRSCGFDIHLECILAPCDDINSPPTHRSAIPAGGPTPPRPPYRPPPYHGPSANYNYGPCGTNYSHNIDNHENQVPPPPPNPPPPYSASVNYNYPPYNYGPYGTNYSPHNTYTRANEVPPPPPRPNPPPPYGASVNYNYAPYNYGPYGTNYSLHNKYNLANQVSPSPPPPPNPPPPYGAFVNYNYAPYNHGPYGTNYSPHNRYDYANQAQGSGAISGRLRLKEYMCLLVQRLAGGVLIDNSPDIISWFLG